MKETSTTTRSTHFVIPAFAILLVVTTLSVTSVPELSAQMVTGIFNDADRTGVFPPRIAQGSVFLIAGSNLWPTKETSVRVSVGDTVVEMPVVSGTGSWVRAVLPVETPEGSGVVVLRHDGRESYPREIRVVRPGIQVIWTKLRDSACA